MIIMTPWVTWGSSHVGKRKNFGPLCLLNHTKEKMETWNLATTLHVGNNGDVTMTSSVKWYPGQNSTRRTLRSIGMKICEVHLGKYLSTEKL